MSRPCPHLLVRLVAVTCALACSQKDPNDSLEDMILPDGESDTSASEAPPFEGGASLVELDSGPGTAEASSTGGDTTQSPTHEICPMMAGATWTYSHSDWTERQTVTTTRYAGENAFVVKDTPDPEDNLRADTILVKRGGRLLRVYKDQYWVNPNNGEEVLDSSATYGVGFLRCDEAWASKLAGWAETPSYLRVETPAGASAKAAEERSHTFTVEGREDLATTNGKRYENCVKVRRSKDWSAAENAEDAREKLYWFCPGVGKVREENVNGGNYEELVEYSFDE